MESKNILPFIWEEIENNLKLAKHQKRAQAVLDWLNKDYLNAIQADNQTFWFEMNGGRAMPNYIYKYLKSTPDK